MAITSDNTLVIRGTATAGHTVTVKTLGGVTLGATTADGAGQWSFDHTGTALADGSYALAASASNGAGASPSSPSFTVRVDTLAPMVVSVNRLNPTAATSSADTITFRVTFSEQAPGVDASDFHAGLLRRSCLARSQACPSRGRRLRRDGRAFHGRG